MLPPLLLARVRSTAARTWVSVDCCTAMAGMRPRCNSGGCEFGRRILSASRREIGARGYASPTPSRPPPG